MVSLAAAENRAIGGDVNSDRSIAFCREKLALPREVLDPAPLITGEDLKELGIPPGRFYALALAKCRDAQLTGEIATNGAARQLVLDLWALDPAS